MDSRQIRSCIAVLLCGVFLAGCSPEPNEVPYRMPLPIGAPCETNIDCGDGQMCFLQTFCAAPCSVEDAPCGKWEEGTCQGGVCWKSCDEHDDCPSGSHCARYLDTCMVGEACDEETFKPYCDGNEWVYCYIGFVNRLPCGNLMCSNWGGCQCYSDAQCGEGLRCVEKMCVPCGSYIGSDRVECTCELELALKNACVVTAEADVYGDYEVGETLLYCTEPGEPVWAFDCAWECGRPHGYLQYECLCRDSLDCQPEEYCDEYGICTVAIY
jgi:hypothetical protein